MSSETPATYEFGPFRLLAEERVLLRDGQPVPLTPKALEILLVLVESHGHVVRKDALMQRVWPDSFVQEDNITYNIWMVRKALGDRANRDLYIQTLARRGYRFAAAVQVQRTGTDQANQRVARR